MLLLLIDFGLISLVYILMYLCLVVLLVLVGPVIAVLANRTGQRNRVAVRTLGHRDALLPEELTQK